MSNVISTVDADGARMSGFASSIAPRTAPDFNVQAIPAAELSPELTAAWSRLLACTPALSSPYFQPHYTRIAASVLPNIEVAILREGKNVVGFFPFERCGGVVARPVGRGLSDYQGVIALPDTPWTADAILAGCRLKAWEFNHQLASQAQIKRYVKATHPSWRMNVAAGYDSYIASRKAATRSVMTKLTSFRKLQREHDIRFVWHTADETALDRLIELKGRHYLRTSDNNPFEELPWLRQFMCAALKTETPEFSGILSAVYAEDILIAAQFGLRSGSMVHVIFPSYCSNFSRYSPGACLLLSMAQAAAAQGVTCIDLGRGAEWYKQIFANDHVDVVEGAIDTRAARVAMMKVLRQARSWIVASPLGPPAKKLRSQLRRMANSPR